MLQYDFFFFFFTMTGILDTGSIHQTGRENLTHTWEFGWFLQLWQFIMLFVFIQLCHCTVLPGVAVTNLTISAVGHVGHPFIYKEENGTFFSLVFFLFVSLEIMWIFPSRKASNLPFFSLICVCVPYCLKNVMFMFG